MSSGTDHNIVMKAEGQFENWSKQKLNSPIIGASVVRDLAAEELYVFLNNGIHTATEFITQEYDRSRDHS